MHWKKQSGPTVDLFCELDKPLALPCASVSSSAGKMTAGITAAQWDSAGADAALLEKQSKASP